MTKYLNKFAIFLVTLCVFLRVCGTAVASKTSAESCANVLAKFGFSIDTYKTTNFDRPNYKHYFLFLISQAKKFSETELTAIKQFDHFIIICDTQSDFEWEGINFCGLDGVQVEDKYARTNFIPIYDDDIEGRHYIVVSEEALTSTLYMDRLSRYFEARNMQDEKTVEGEIVSGEDETFIKQYLHNIAFFIGGILLLSALFGRELLSVIRDPKILVDVKKYKGIIKLITAPVKGFCKEFCRRLKKNKKFFPYLAVYSVLFTILVSIRAIFVTARKNSGVSINFAYCFEYLIKALYPGNYAYYIKHNSSPELVLVISYMWTLIIVCVSRIANITKAVREFVKTISTKEVNAEFLRFAIPLLSVPTVAITAFLSPARASVFLVGYIFLMFYFAFLANESHIDITSLYSPGVKAALFFVLGFTAIGFLALKRIDLKNALPETLSLVGEDAEVVVLPHVKKYHEKSHFADYLAALSSSLFVDDYLVYKPGFTEIKNANIADFKPQGNFVVENPSKEDLATQLVQNEELRNYLGAEEPASLLFIENFKFDPEAVYSVNVGITCENATITSRKVRVKTYFFDAKMIDQEFNVFDFPGCTPETEGFSTGKQLTAPFRLIVVPDNSIVVFELKGIPERAITDFSILENGRPYEQKFVLYNVTKDFLVDNEKKNDSTIYYYSWGIQEKFDLTSDNLSEINISKIINEMKDRGILENPLTIWSPENPHAIIKNLL